MRVLSTLKARVLVLSGDTVTIIAVLDNQQSEVVFCQRHPDQLRRDIDRLADELGVMLKLESGRGCN